MNQESKVFSMNKLHEKLNIYLANQEIMFIKLHNLHWYVKGSGFFVLHSKFEELYDQTAEIIDEVAERMLALGLSPVASMKKALTLSAVKELEDVPISSALAVEKLKNDIEYWITDTKEIIALAGEEGDVITEGLFTDYLTEYEKLNWMLDSFLEN